MTPSDSPAEAVGADRVARFVAAGLLRYRTRKMFERLDRCCHGGIVSYRVPLWYRIHAANRCWDEPTPVQEA